MLRRSERSVLRTPHSSLLASVDPAGSLAALLAPCGLSYACGGSEVGGTEATRLLSASFSHLDCSVLELTGQYQTAERVVLMREGSVVAAAVVHLHVSTAAIEVPIFATAKACRRQGHGSTLLALLLGFGRKLGVTTLIVSATDESRAFWLKQGLHTLQFCTSRERGAVRALDQAGLLRGFANSHLMARGVPDSTADDNLGCLELVEAVDRSGAER